jgi:hypothetical protein
MVEEGARQPGDVEQVLDDYVADLDQLTDEVAALESRVREKRDEARSRLYAMRVARDPEAMAALARDAEALGERVPDDAVDGEEFARRYLGGDRAER